jgi:hypothetical protein
LVFSFTYNHKKSTKQKHEKKVCRFAPERAFFQVAAVSICEQNIEQKVVTNK